MDRNDVISVGNERRVSASRCAFGGAAMGAASLRRVYQRCDEHISIQQQQHAYLDTNSRTQQHVVKKKVCAFTTDEY